MATGNEFITGKGRYFPRGVKEKALPLIYPTISD
jgi:hypothetical protein